MFKAFTGSESKASGKPPAKNAPTVPPATRRASALMLGGAAGTVVFGIYGVIAALTSKAAVIHYYESLNHMTASQANSGFAAAVVFTIVVCLAFAAVWVFMARANRAGLGWARVASSVLFLLWTYGTWRSFATANTTVGLVDLIIMLVIWGIGGAALSQLWLPETSAFMKSSRAGSTSR